MLMNFNFNIDRSNWNEIPSMRKINNLFKQLLYGYDLQDETAM